MQRWGAVMNVDDLQGIDVEWSDGWSKCRPSYFGVDVPFVDERCFQPPAMAFLKECKKLITVYKCHETCTAYHFDSDKRSIKNTCQYSTYKVENLQRQLVKIVQQT